MFEWATPPEEAFGALMEDYTDATYTALYQICVKYAALIQTYMRANAPWEDKCMPEREYLYARAWSNPAAYVVGILVGYDLELYRAKCGEPPFDWGQRHELYTFAKKGVISIIAPRGETEGAAAATALGSLADDLWDEVRALYASSGLASYELYSGSLTEKW